MPHPLGPGYMNHLLPECDKPLAQIAATCAALKQLRPHCQPPDTVEKVRELVLDLVARGKLTDRELKTICPASVLKDSGDIWGCRTLWWRAGGASARLIFAGSPMVPAQEKPRKHREKRHKQA